MAELHLNPYEGVDWDGVERHKAQLHAHTWYPPEGSHSGTDPPAVVVDDYRDAGYSVLALTDHEYNVDGPTWPWTGFDRDPDELGMVAVPGVELAVELGEAERLGDRAGGREGSTDGPRGETSTDGQAGETSADGPTGEVAADAQTGGASVDAQAEGASADGPTEHDLLSLFCDLSDTAGLGFDGALAEVGERDGLAVVPHPSRYFETGAWYERYFRAHPHLLGVEVVNAADRYPTDRDVWDDLQERLGADRPVWGFSNDDYHGRGLEYAFDRSRNVLLVDELTGPAVRDALVCGRFLYQHVVEEDLDTGGAGDRGNPDREGPPAGTADYRAGEDAPPPRHPPVGAEPPTVEAVRHDPDAGTLTVEARDYEVLQWAAAGEVVNRSPTLRYREVEALGSFARARLVAASGSETGTQPFLFR